MQPFKLLLFLFLTLSVNCFSQNQGINNNWLQGYTSAGGPLFGETRLDFFTGTPIITSDSIEMDFRHTHANISDSTGNMLFYTNGYYIADATNDTMQNGSGINPGAYANFVPDGFLIPQGALSIRKPNSANIYYVFHNSADGYSVSPPNSISYFFYLTTIDMSLNFGKGKVISKNSVLIADSMNCGKISACKHANGRDWWVICHRVNTNKYFKFLVTPTGITGSFSQNIGLNRIDDAGQAKFSPDGTKFAYYHYKNGLDIMDFDRCTGVFSNVISDISLPVNVGNVGCEFSPNSRFLYVTNVLDIYQYDLYSANILNSKITVANWDGFYQPGAPGLTVYLCLSQLAPDGKIYITTGNATTYFGTIDYPDSTGLSCTVAQHSVVVPTYNFNTLPNHPNYFLGCDTTLGCPCAITTSTNEITSQQNPIKIFPNPTTGNFTLQFNVQSTTGIVQVYDINSKLVLQQSIAPWSQYKHLNITNLPQGIYLCKLKWGNVEAGVKVIKE